MLDLPAFRKNEAYFQGWYFKHQSGQHAVAFIPGVNVNAQGQKSAFVQVITDRFSCKVPFPYTAFQMSNERLAVRVGNQLFSDRGVRVDLNTPELQCKGIIRYGTLDPPESDVMGPFRFVPLLECRHGVVSMKHSLNGSLKLNGETINFTGGCGYIEKDEGSSFPKNYLWAQCNSFSEKSCGIMVSIADVPFVGLHLKGCIAVIHFRGYEFRLATYYGVKVLRCDERGFLLWQKDYLLEADIEQSKEQSLFAPSNGAMSRTIRESVMCRARFRFYVNSRLIFDLQSEEAGFEFVK